MEKFIWIIKSVSELNGNERVDILWAVNTEEAAKEDVENYNERAKKENQEIEGFQVWYIYEKIRLFEQI